MLNETQGDWSVAGEKWLLAADAGEVLDFSLQKVKDKKKKRL